MNPGPPRDDIDGTPGAERVTFAFSTSWYELCLGERNREALSAAFAPWVAAARVVDSHVGPPRPPSGPARLAEAAEVRAWAIERGLPVSRRRFPSPWVVEEYKKAHPDK